eukprot:12258959-Prorocentrum_lima.AAC.1
MMTVIFKDWEDQLEEDGYAAEDARLPGFNISDILYADDTTLISGTSRMATRMVQTLQRVAEPYGLYLNRDKCE